MSGWVDGENLKYNHFMILMLIGLNTASVNRLSGLCMDSCPANPEGHLQRPWRGCGIRGQSHVALEEGL